jgi:hypothetical protein
MNSERYSQNDVQQVPFSPKKKLHVKDKCSLADTVSNARENLKNAKDISARNLLAACSARGLSNSNPSLEGICTSDDDIGGGSDSDSSYDEIVAIEEENTDYVSEKDLFDSDEESMEEIVEEYYEEVVATDGDDSCYDSEDSELEPLPPPIVIPDSLKVKDSDDEESYNNDNDEDDDDDDDSGYDDPQEELPQFKGSDQGTKPPSVPIVTKAASDRQPEKPKHESLRPSTLRGYSIGSPTRAAELPTSPPKTPVKELQPHKTSTPKTPVKEFQPTTPKAQNPPIKESQPTTPKSLETPAKETQPQVNKPTQPSTPKTLKIPTKESQPTTPKMIAAAIKADSFKGNENKLRPGAIRGFSFQDDEVKAPPKEKRGGRNPFTKPSPPLEEAEPFSKSSPPSDDSIGVWEKPEWTKNSKLRSTGKSPSGNLAKPITSLPRIAAPKSPPKTNTTTATISAPKTAPQPPRKKYTAATPPPVNARSVDDDDVPDKIGWEKPEWTKRKLLRQTSKSATVFSGGRIERPIGGIRPIEEN